jgi:hypothetical protein
MKNCLVFLTLALSTFVFAQGEIKCELSTRAVGAGTYENTKSLMLPSGKNGTIDLQGISLGIEFSGYPAGSFGSGPFSPTSVVLSITTQGSSTKATTTVSMSEYSGYISLKHDGIEAIGMCFMQLN